MMTHKIKISNKNFRCVLCDKDRLFHMKQHLGNVVTTSLQPLYSFLAMRNLTHRKRSTRSEKHAGHQLRRP